MELIYMEITKKQAEEFAIKIVQDRSIDDDSFEETFQYIRDDLFYYASKCHNKTDFKNIEIMLWEKH